MPLDVQKEPTISPFIKFSTKVFDIVRPTSRQNVQKASLTKVELGRRTPGYVEILNGLSPGDMVVTEGQMKIRDGAPVMVLGGAQ